MKKTLTASVIMGFLCLLLTGCQTPEERAVSQMKHQMRLQLEMMQRMRKGMAEMEKEMGAMEKQLNEAN